MAGLGDGDMLTSKQRNLIGALVGGLVGLVFAWLLAVIVGVVYLAAGFEAIPGQGFAGLLGILYFVTGGVLGGRRGRTIARSWRPIEVADGNDS